MTRLPCSVAALPNIRSWAYVLEGSSGKFVLCFCKSVSTKPQRVDPAHCGVPSLMLRAKTNLSLYKLTVLGSYLQRKTNQHRGRIDFLGLLFRRVNAASSHTKLCSRSRMIQHTGGCGVHMHAHKCTWTPRKAKGIEGC